MKKRTARHLTAAWLAFAFGTSSALAGESRAGDEALDDASPEAAEQAAANELADELEDDILDEDIASPDRATGGGMQPDAPPLSDLPTREVPVPDLIPAYLPTLLPPPLGRAALSVVLSTQTSYRGRDFSGGVVLELPFDGFVSRKAKHGSGSKGPRNDAADEEADQAGEAGDVAKVELDDTRAPKRGRRPRSSPSWSLPVLRPRDARAAVAASRRHRGVVATLDDLDSMAQRARYGSLLPTLRLRATRLVDESVALSPTSYDADRTTTRGGASLWLEARATWNLDRLVFASEEVRVGRMQLSYASKERRASQSVVKKLFAWQRAVYAMHDPSLPFSACVDAWLREQELAASLDLATGGWFAKWSLGKAGPTPDCVEAFREDSP